MLDFVILHYGDYHVTDECVRSILRMHGQEEIRIVVVDNEINKNAARREKLKEHYSHIQNLTVLTVTENGGFSHANNIGYEYAKNVDHADWICVINNDIEFTQRDFPELIRKVYAETGCAVLSPDVVKKSDGEHQSPMDLRIRNAKEASYTIKMNTLALKLYPAVYPLLYKRQCRLDENRLKEKKGNAAFYEVRQEDIVPFGACLIFTPSYIEGEERAFEPETHFYYEEYLLAHRCGKKRLKIVYDPTIKVFHESGQATRRSMGSEYRRMRFMMKETKAAAEVYLEHITERKQQNMKPSMLYFMPVDWNWIAQRPHFLAIALEKDFDIKVLYPHFLIRNWTAQKETPTPKKLEGVTQIPLQEKIPFLRMIGDRIFRHHIGDIHQYDVIWLGTPLYYRFIPDDYKGTVIYDYMDDIVALQGDPVVAKIVKKRHEQLLKRADYIFATSRYLKDHLPAEVQEKIILLRNGYQEGSVYDPEIVRRPGKIYRLGYIGTVSKWMDFALIRNSLERFDNIEYHFWGPVATEVPQHPRIIMHGIVEHKELYNQIRDIDCLIMPFLLNDITLAVDPVKLYEYISFGKCIISVAYPEVMRFDNFAWLYHTQDEYYDIIKKLVEGTISVKYNQTEQLEFLEDNSWDAREKKVNEIAGHINR